MCPSLNSLRLGFVEMTPLQFPKSGTINSAIAADLMYFIIFLTVPSTVRFALPPCYDYRSVISYDHPISCVIVQLTTENRTPILITQQTVHFLIILLRARNTVYSTNSPHRTSNTNTHQNFQHTLLLPLLHTSQSHALSPTAINQSQPRIH